MTFITATITLTPVVASFLQLFCVNMPSLNGIILTAWLIVLVNSQKAFLTPCDPNVADSPNCNKHSDSCRTDAKRALCKKYCGLCKTDDCIDTQMKILCDKRKSLCDVNEDVAFVCRKTCGFCDDSITASTAAPTATPTAVGATAAATRPYANWDKAIRVRAVNESVAEIKLTMAGYLYFGVIFKTSKAVESFLKSKAIKFSKAKVIDVEDGHTVRTNEPVTVMTFHVYGVQPDAKFLSTNFNIKAKKLKIQLNDYLAKDKTLNEISEEMNNNYRGLVNEDVTMVSPDRTQSIKSDGGSSVSYQLAVVFGVTITLVLIFAIVLLVIAIRRFYNGDAEKYV